MLDTSVERDPDRSGCSAPIHGDEYAYNNAVPPCRCPDARADHTRKSKHRRLHPRHVPALGAVRRARALSAAGHASPIIATAAGISTKAIQELTMGKYQSVSVCTDRALRRALKVLGHRPGSSAWVRNAAAKKGWPAPHEWWPGELDDPAADPRAVTEEPSEDGDADALVSAAKYRGLRWNDLTAGDQDCLVEALRADDHTLAGIAELTGTSQASVQRAVNRIARRRTRSAA